MEAKKCDLCGTFYEPYKHTERQRRPNKPPFEISIKTYKINGLNTECGSIDLCKECLKKELQLLCDNLY